MKKSLLAIIVIAIGNSFSLFCQNSLVNAWDSVPQILSRVNAPQFSSATFNIVDYGAVSGGSVLCTSAINNAISACNAAGGGKVVVPAGTYLTGAIHLRSNVNLYVSKDAILLFSTSPSDYLPVVLTRFEGVECYNYSPFIYAYGQSNIAITGSGTLDGNASYASWWDWKTMGDADRTDLFEMAESGVAVSSRVFGAGHYIRPVFVQPYSCQNILIDSVTILRSPMWEINPVLCENVTVSNVTIESHGVNNDGCNPECSKDVWIHHCTFNTGDDCIAIKSGRNNDGRRVNVPSENIVIQNCTMIDGHGGVVLGSEISGSVRNVFAEDCVMSSSNLERALRVKTNSVRGGTIENIHLRNIQVGQVARAYIEVNMNYEEGDVGLFTPNVRNFSVQNLVGSTSPKVFNVSCYERTPIIGLLLKDCDLTASSLGTLYNVRKVQVVNSTVNGEVPLLPSVSSSYQHAELYSDKNNWGWSNVSSSYTGTGYMEPCDSDNALEYKVYVASDEDDMLEFYYQNPSTVSKECAVYVNDEYQTTIEFPSASSWSTASVVLSLQSDTSVVRLVADGGEGELFLDRIIQSYSGPYTGLKESIVSVAEFQAIITNGDTQLFSFVSSKQQIAKLQVYDFVGRICDEKMQRFDIGENRFEMSLSLPKGAYWARLSSDDGSVNTCKFIVK